MLYSSNPFDLNALFNFCINIFGDVKDNLRLQLQVRTLKTHLPHSSFYFDTAHEQIP